MRQLSEIQFNNSYVDSLKEDPCLDNNTRQVPNASYSFTKPSPVKNPKLIAWSDDAANLLGCTKPEKDSESLYIISGNQINPSMKPYAARYGGYQFGHWASQLGDGRAINLGEVVHTQQNRWEIQLKGAGPTPYSRRADGRAVLRSSLREFLCSEAMFYLGVPTTRALSLVGTGEMVIRDMFYDGNPQEEPGAIVCRLSPSFIRFGNFEIHAANSEIDLLRRLIEFTIDYHFMEFSSKTNTRDTSERYTGLFNEVCRRTAIMIAHWMRVGFVHGVMNTDNMSVLGLTIDYGPYGWLEGYDHGWTPNTTDKHGKRYSFGQQPGIAFWNLARFAEALSPAMEDPSGLPGGLKIFKSTFHDAYTSMMGDKLGISLHEEDNNESFLNDLTILLHETETDMTIFFRKLSDIPLDTPDSSDCLIEYLADSYYDLSSINDEYKEMLLGWVNAYKKKISVDSLSPKERKHLMNSSNPCFVLRNYITHKASEDINKGEYGLLDELMEVIKNPYEQKARFSHLYEKRPEWARNKAGCSMLSCSS
jgi:serine/tyrosine/threonine adenylyltransferase